MNSVLMDPVDLLNAFTSIDGFETMMNALLPALNNANSAAAAVLALEGLFRIEENVRSGQFTYQFNVHVREGIREFLRKWRCESPLDQAYGGAFKRVKPFLRSLTIFKALQVPLFIDDYGTKRLMSQYIDVVTKHEQTQSQLLVSTVLRVPLPVSIVYPPWMSPNDRQTIGIEDIPINLDTPIVHVTHTVQKDSILADQMFKPSANKNSIEGVWFSPKYQLGYLLHSVYGSWAFETTLRSLGVAWIRQGEIVSYKQEVNFILYASDTVTVPPGPVRKATDSALRLFENNPCVYGAVSIFVPSRFLPQVQQQVIPSPYQIRHHPFCVKEKRGEIFRCAELM